jgi:sugar phosphate isomerase/epimerase
MAYSFQRALEAGELDLAGVIRLIAQLGVNAIELMDSLVRAEEVPAIRAALAEAGLSLACYDLRCDVVASDPIDRQAHTARFCTRLPLAASVGASHVMVVPGLPGEGLPPSLARQWFCEALQESLPVASRLGLTLSVENLGILPEVYGRSEQILGICEAVGPELRVTYDAGNFLLASEDSLEGLARLAPKVAHVHFKDWKVVPSETECAYLGVDGRLYQGAALGDGLVDLREIVNRLAELEYHNSIAVEYEGPGDAQEAVRRGVEHLRGLLTAVAERKNP